MLSSSVSVTQTNVCMLSQCLCDGSDGFQSNGVCVWSVCGYRGGCVEVVDMMEVECE